MLLMKYTMYNIDVPSIQMLIRARPRDVVIDDVVVVIVFLFLRTRSSIALILYLYICSTVLTCILHDYLLRVDCFI